MKKARLHIFLIMLLFLVISQPSFSYTGKAEKDNILCFSKGGVIQKLHKNMAVIKCVQPCVVLKVKNTGNSDKVIRLKCKNVSPSLYGATIKEGELEYSGVNFVTFKITLSPGSMREITIAPLKKDIAKYTFAVLGDSRYRTRVHRKILKEISKSNALFAINLGDIVNHGTEKEYRNYMKEVSDFPLPYYVVPGNHEIYAPGGFQRFLDYISPVDYSFDVGKFHFIMLDTSKGRIRDTQFKWLKKEMKDRKNIFIFHHVPPFSPHPKKQNHILASKKEAKRFMSLLEKYKVKAMFGGHIHAFLRKKLRGVDYIIAGCAGAYPVVPPSQGGYPHYVLVDVDGDNYKIRVYKVSER